MELKNRFNSEEQTSVELAKVPGQSQEQVNQSAGLVAAQVSRQFDKVHL